MTGLKMFNILHKRKHLNNIPSFLIIGAQKAGTTSLFEILNNICLFSGSANKELHYFNKDFIYKNGIDWYLSNFSNKENQLTFEATPAYIYYDNVPERIYRYNPNMKFIVILREPSSRCLSHWNMFRKFNKNREVAQSIWDTFTKYSDESIRSELYNLLFGEKFPNFSDCIKLDIDRYFSLSKNIEPSFVRRGLYVYQIERYLKYFDKSSMLIINFDEMKYNMKNILINICTFLGVDAEIDYDGVIGLKKNEGDYSDMLDGNFEKELSFLKGFYYAHNEKLFSLLNVRYDWND